ncbi:MAG: sulfotransferase [Gammaproteobacteria bacterium]|jgi:hypothetical protein|nr:sulfotransferase [Gammaproteobacteria bacterium]
MAVIQKIRHLIIAGVNKGGTTTLFSILGQHPEICPSSVKETCYFLPERYGKKRERGEVYQHYFDAHGNEQWLLEATPGYLYGGVKLIEAIRQVTGHDTRILIVLREPVSRTFSYFRKRKSIQELKGDITFSDYIARCLELSGEDLVKEENNIYFGIEGSKYADYLPVWLDEFGDNIRIIFFDELVSNQVAVIKDICIWLGLDSNSLIEQVKEGVNENRTIYTRYKILQWPAIRAYRILEAFFRRHYKIKTILTRLYYFLNRAQSSPETLDPLDKASLENFYHPYNKKLATMLIDRNKSLPAWLEKHVEE